MRKAMFGLEDQDTIRNLLLDDDDENNVVFLDVRNPDEVAETSLLKEKNIPFVEARYLLSDGDDDDKSKEQLQEQLQRDLPKKSSSDTTTTTKFVVFCAKGGRAMKAIDTLTKKLGYDGNNIYNAGGVSDVLELL
eukprot:CAMPEP_0113467074 /NCGR_PEP_ID=MMETSP0014_2-20120614/14618_1 /TAXON_ID=2857 /ORGANISM="Nitzschia sp." /LENGTH=134 /DNA_ID=CAMNT_0000359353 /DNA_START=380 /DNA_END=784 /DNA_ORIENTATION=- /assembly_acc=CAM_ASM_000159